MIKPRTIAYVVGGAVLSVVAMSLVMGSFYTVEEGHVAVVKRFGEAQYQEGPGLHFKAPFVDTIEEIEVRTRKNTEKLSAATDEQMPVSIVVSVNWTVAKVSAIDLFKEYGSLEQFESRILDPRLKSATKAAISKYTAENLIRNRNLAVTEIIENLSRQMTGFPVTLDSVQLDNVTLPPQYLKSIEDKQTAKNLAAAEEFKLARQKLEAQRDVNTAEAKAEATMLEAKAAAAAIEMKGEAEAKAIKAKAEALKNNPLIVELTKAQNWNGELPRMITSDSGGMILSIKE